MKDCQQSATKSLELPPELLDLFKREDTKIETVIKGCSQPATKSLVKELCRLTGWKLKVELGNETEFRLIVPYQMVNLFGADEPEYPIEDHQIL
jgi:hypothetical protein